jgi:hypothetical protein
MDPKYVDLPEGFQVVNQPQNNQQYSDLPKGFQVMEQPKQPKMGRGEAAFITATNPLNFGDEIKAGIAALTAKTFGGAATKDIDIGDLYREARTSERAKLKQAQETYPIQSAAVGFASDIPFEAYALGKAGLTGASSVPKLMAGGGGLATLGGAGASEKETVGGVAQDALTSGAIGAIAAPVLASAIPSATNMIGKGASAVKGMFSKKTGEQIAQEAISPESARKGLEQLKSSPKSQPTTALDIDTPEFQNLIKTTMSKYPQSKQIAAEFAAGRKEETAKRISDILSKDISPVEDYFGNYAKKRTTQKTIGSMNYDKAYSYKPKIGSEKQDSFNGYIFEDKQLEKLINSRSDFTNKAAKEASDLFQIEHGIKIDPKEFLTPSTHNVDMLKKGLDVLIDRETDAVTGKVTAKGRQLNIYKDALVDRMDQLNPDYKKARNIYAGDFSIQKSQELGRKFDKFSPEELKIKLNKLGSSEIDSFRVGQRLRMQELADKSKQPAEKLFGNEHIKKQLQSSFKGNEKRFAEFSQKMKEEISYDKTIKNYGLDKHEVETNPNILSKLVGNVISLASGSKVSFQGMHAVKTALTRHYEGLNEKSAEELTKILINKKSSIELLEKIASKADSTQKPIIQKAINDIYPTILGATLGYKLDIMSDANAKEPSLSEEQIRQQMLESNQQDMRQGLPSTYTKEDLKNNPPLIKKRYYRD